MPKKKKVGGAGRAEEGVHERRAGRKLAAGPPGWPTRAAPLAPYATSESGAPVLFGPLPRRAAAFLRFFFLAAPLSPLPRPSVPARVHGEAALCGPLAGRLEAAPTGCSERLPRAALMAGRSVRCRAL